MDVPLGPFRVTLTHDPSRGPGVVMHVRNLSGDLLVAHEVSNNLRHGQVEFAIPFWAARIRIQDTNPHGIIAIEATWDDAMSHWPEVRAFDPRPMIREQIMAEIEDKKKEIAARTSSWRNPKLLLL